MSVALLAVSLAKTLLVLKGMSVIPAGSYTPLYGGARVHVASFALDRNPVTRADYLRFITEHPEWRRSTVRTTRTDVAEPSYLDEWRGDLDAGDANDLRRPVTGISQYAAEAYCAAHGKRLPTLDEWEYAAAASETKINAATDAAFVRRLAALYSSRPAGSPRAEHRGFTNIYGIAGLHGDAWEWTETAGAAHDASCAGAAMGAPDPSNYPAFLRFAFRSALTKRSTLRSLGFRCAA